MSFSQSTANQLKNRNDKISNLDLFLYQKYFPHIKLYFISHSEPVLIKHGEMQC